MLKRLRKLWTRNKRNDIQTEPFVFSDAAVAVARKLHKANLTPKPPLFSEEVLRAARMLQGAVDGNAGGDT